MNWACRTSLEGSWFVSSYFLPFYLHSYNCSPESWLPRFWYLVTSPSITVLHVPTAIVWCVDSFHFFLKCIITWGFPHFATQYCPLLQLCYVRMRTVQILLWCCYLVSFSTMVWNIGDTLWNLPTVLAGIESCYGWYCGAKKNRIYNGIGLYVMAVTYCYRRYGHNMAVTVSVVFSLCCAKF